MKIPRLTITGVLVWLSIALAGCPFGSNDDSTNPEPNPGSATKVEILKLDWDSVSVSMEQTSRTVDNEANVLMIGSADACGGCKDWFLFAVIDQQQCGRNGWQCSSRGNVQINFENLSIGQQSSLGWQAKAGSKLTISTLDGSPFISGMTATKNYQIKQIEIESRNETLSRNNGDIGISTPECPAVNQNFLWQSRDEGDTRRLIVDLASKMSNKKYALAVKISDLNRWCASTSYKTMVTSLKGEKFTLTPSTTTTVGTGEFIGQDLADLLIADVEDLYDYSHGSTYFWLTDEVEVISGTDTIQYYKRGVTNDPHDLKYAVSKLNYHFEDNDSIFVMLEGEESFHGTWKFPDKTKYDRIIINGYKKGTGYGYNNVELKIDKLEKHVFNFTREIDLTNFDYYASTPYSIEQRMWLDVVDFLNLPYPAKFNVRFKMIPYR